ncbi:hypothetical protein [Actinoplanes philippinensis]|nr:hypothetical protein [Actinoplanes philippinensis]
MSLHLDENAVRANAADIAGRAAKRKSRKIWAFAAVGTLMATGAAYAAVQLFSYGTISQDAATMKELNLTEAKLTGSLVPGQTVGGSVKVANPNDFPVKVTAVILKDASLQATGQGCDPATVSPGGSVAAYPAGGAGHKIVLAAPVTINANGGPVTVTVPGAVSQAGTATGLCAVSADFAVEASVGS